MGGWEGENVNQTAPLGKGNRPGELSWTFIKQHQGAGLEIMAGQLTMPRLIGDLTGQLFVLPVMLRCHIIMIMLKMKKNKVSMLFSCFI